MISQKIMELRYLDFIRRLRCYWILKPIKRHWNLRAQSTKSPPGEIETDLFSVPAPSTLSTPTQTTWTTTQAQSTSAPLARKGGCSRFKKVLWRQICHQLRSSSGRWLMIDNDCWLQKKNQEILTWWVGDWWYHLFFWGRGMETGSVLEISPFSSASVPPLNTCHRFISSIIDS